MATNSVKQPTKTTKTNEPNPRPANPHVVNMPKGVKPSKK